jgi:hypothetical protein
MAKKKETWSFVEQPHWHANGLHQQRQLEFDFEQKTADQLPTESAAANTHPTDEVRNAGS